MNALVKTTSLKISINKIALNLIAVVIGGLVLFNIGPRGTAIGKERKNPYQDVSNLLSPFTRNGLENVGVSEGVGGAAWLDYNNDQKLDLFITNGVGHANGLFRNNGDGTFTDVAVEAGISDVDGHSGVVAADIDNDGCTDLFLTGEGTFAGISDEDPTESSAKLYINNCDNEDDGIFTFTDITVDSGIPEQAHGASAAFGDINNDSFLDLFIARPNVSSIAKDQKNGVFLNNGNRTFTDITEMTGLGFAIGACAASFSDYNKDGWIDIFVANCADLDLTIPGLNPIQTPFQLLRNNGDLTFTDVAPEAGLVDLGGWMAVTLADIDGDLDMDLFATNVGNLIPIGFPHILYENNGDGTYTNVAAEAGVADWEFGWGASFTDCDNDGDEDLFYAGSLPMADVIGPGLGSPGRLFLNNGEGEFTRAAAFGQAKKFTSGVAVGDFDNNGFPDVVVVSTTITPPDEPQVPGKPLLLKNKGNRNNWLTVRLVGTTSNRGGVGARVRVRVGNLRQVKEVYAGSSFLSTNSPWLTFGFENRKRRANIVVIWPSGLTERFVDVATNQAVTLVEATGTTISN